MFVCENVPPKRRKQGVPFSCHAAVARLEPKAAVQAMKLGATDYVPKPFDNDELRMVVRRAFDLVQLRRDHRRLLAQTIFPFVTGLGAGTAFGKAVAGAKQEWL